jgi:hypothetical protein
MGEDFRKLLEAEDGIYDVVRARERARGLMRLYGECEADEGLACAVIERARRSFWAWLCFFGWTYDPKGGGRMRVKPFSPRVVYKILADFADERDESGGWLHPTIFVAKSRQLMMSWFVVHRLVWSGIFSEYGEYPIISKTEDDAGDLVRRVRSVLANLPVFLRVYGGWHPVRESVGGVEFKNQSRIWAMAQRGGDAARGVVPTMYFFDEAAFQSDFDKNYQAMRGTAFSRETQGWVVSTAQASPFWDLVSDAMDGGRGGVGRIYHESEGLRIHENARNRIDVVRMHYRVLAERRDEGWLREARRGVPMHVWRQEFEIDPYARGGHPVFPMLDRDAHCTLGRVMVVRGEGGVWRVGVEGDIDPETGGTWWRDCVLMRMMDHGTHGYHGTLWIAVTTDDERDWYVYRERKRSGWVVGANAQEVDVMSGEEEYVYDDLDGFDRLPEGQGQVIDLYRTWRRADGECPFRRLRLPRKGAGSRQEGLDAIGTMLLSTLAVEMPSHRFWAESGYSDDHRLSLAEHSRLYLDRGCVELFRELEDARYDIRRGADADLLARRETTVDMADDLIDCLRYGIRAGGHMIRSRRRG